MTQKEFLDQIDGLLDQAKREVYRRAGRLAGTGQIDPASLDPHDHSLAKAVIAATTDQCFHGWSQDQRDLISQLKNL